MENQLYYDADLPDPSAPEAQQWSISDDGAADWALRKIKEANEEYERLRMIGERMIKEAQERIRKLEQDNQSRTGFLKLKLAEYFDSVPHKKTKTKETYALFSGKLALKYHNDKITRDDSKLLEWVNDHGLTDYIKTEQSIKWADLKEQFEFAGGRAIYKETGEIVDAIQVQPIDATFDIE